MPVDILHAILELCSVIKHYYRVIDRLHTCVFAHNFRVTVKTVGLAEDRKPPADAEFG